MISKKESEKENKGRLKEESKEEAKKEKEEQKTSEEEESKTKDERIRDLTETLQRLQADFENYKKRVERERILFREYAAVDFIRELLPVLDSFELAIRNNNCDAEKLKKGLEIIYAQFYSILNQAGLRPIDALGERFDAYKHEVLMTQPSEDDGIVLEEFQKGYTFKDAVIRHSRVKVGKKEDNKEEKC